MTKDADDTPTVAGSASAGRLQRPWVSPEWWDDEQSRGRDPHLDRVLARFGGGRPSRLYSTPLQMASAASANPYLNLGWSLVAVGVGVFLTLRIAPIALGLTVGGLFWLLALLIGTMAALQIPKWHRLRRVAKTYLQKRGGGKLPPELRWYR